MPSSKTDRRVVVIIGMLAMLGASVGASGQVLSLGGERTKGSPHQTQRDPISISARDKAEARYMPSGLVEILWQGNVRVNKEKFP